MTSSQAPAVWAVNARVTSARPGQSLPGEGLTTHTELSASWRPGIEDPSCSTHLIEVRAEEPAGDFEVSSEGKPPQQEAIHFDLLAWVGADVGPLMLMAARPLANQRTGWPGLDVKKAHLPAQALCDVVSAL